MNPSLAHELGVAQRVRQQGKDDHGAHRHYSVNRSRTSRHKTHLVRKTTHSVLWGTIEFFYGEKDNCPTFTFVLARYICYKTYCRLRWS